MNTSPQSFTRALEIPRMVVAGTHSGVGKTTIATALIAAFTRRGLRVQPFKIGPDFIDPGFHCAASNRVSRNLDGWMLSRESNLEIFSRACTDADLAIVEGVMGLFDGYDGSTDRGSTAEMAKWLDAPVLLVIDASAMARSAAAVLHGFENLDSALDVGGVLFNRTGGAGHAQMLHDAVIANCRARPLGCLPHDDQIALPGRHLGLTMAAESLTPECLGRMAAWIEDSVDLDGLLDLARTRSRRIEAGPIKPRSETPPANPGARIGIARDAAFCFYYQDNLDLLSECGAELVEFSPIHDRDLPADLDALYLGGGYPELHAASLAQNASMRLAIRKFCQSATPAYAECGGFMYLTEAIVDGEGREFPMVGIFPTRARMQPNLAALGYVEVRVAPGIGSSAQDFRGDPQNPACWLDPHTCARGHEFRFSTIDPMPETSARVYAGPAEGFRIQSTIASYIHLHFRSAPRFARAFVDRAALNRERRKSAIQVTA